ncbi:MFS transporter [Bacillus luteolus]|uniref:MFS transporter n=1 Tax=Litchfieldia luteola TaxID=682179 RepID=A0ABR9QGE1_9BACI|nr:MFS transporter [Cytobacillus luteolus]MBE4907560.1 MFS transporter [Cytobacillus luteolus]MBP1944333.1 MFS family permease [Cytobacillus luteolus]
MKNNVAFLKEEKKYTRFLTSVFISGVGDWFHSIAVFSLLMHLSNTSVALGITMALRVLPHLLFGPIGGLLADRFSKKKILVICDFVQALAAFSLIFVSTAEDIWMIYVSTFILMSATAIQMPTRSSSIPLLVKKENILKANSLHSTAFGIMMVLGSMLGGIVTTILESNLAFGVNAITLVIAGSIMLTTRFPKHEYDETNEKFSLKQYKVVFPLIRKVPIIQLILIYYVLWAIGGGVMNLIPNVFAFEVYGLENIGVGILYACFGIGQILGGYLSPYFEKWPKQAIAIGFLIEGIAYTFFSFSPNILVGGLMLIIALTGVSVGNTFVGTMVMQYIPEKYLGRLFSVIYTLVNVILGTTMILTGALLAKIAPEQMALLSGLLITVPAIIIGYGILKSGTLQSELVEKNM